LLLLLVSNKEAGIKKIHFMSRLLAGDAIQEARSSEYFGRNDAGKPICKLCNIYCSDEHKFLTHLSGNKHRKMLEGLKRQRERDDKSLEEARAFDDMIRERKQVKPQAASASSLLNAAKIFCPFGQPLYRYRLDPDPDSHTCKVFLEFEFPKISEETRPMHRWKGAREQNMERPDDGVVYLLIACEGYETVALKFPAHLPRTDDLTPGDGKFRTRWDPTSKTLHLFFVIG
jgi:hypothetical protein